MKCLGLLCLIVGGLCLEIAGVESKDAQQAEDDIAKYAGPEGEYLLKNLVNKAKATLPFRSPRGELFSLKIEEKIYGERKDQILSQTNISDGVHDDGGVQIGLLELQLRLLLREQRVVSSFHYFTKPNALSHITNGLIRALILVETNHLSSSDISYINELTKKSEERASQITTYQKKLKELKQLRDSKTRDSKKADPPISADFKLPKPD